MFLQPIQEECIYHVEDYILLFLYIVIWVTLKYLFDHKGNAYVDAATGAADPTRSVLSLDANVVSSLSPSFLGKLFLLRPLLFLPEALVPTNKANELALDNLNET